MIKYLGPGVQRGPHPFEHGGELVGGVVVRLALGVIPAAGWMDRLPGGQLDARDLQVAVGPADRGDGGLALPPAR